MLPLFRCKKQKKATTAQRMRAPTTEPMTIPAMAPLDREEEEEEEVEVGGAVTGAGGRRPPSSSSLPASTCGRSGRGAWRSRAGGGGAFEEAKQWWEGYTP